MAKSLSLQENSPNKEPSVELFTDPVKLALEKHKESPSIASMDNQKFSFMFVSFHETLDGVNNLNLKKDSQTTDIQVKNINENKDLVSS